MFGGNFLLNKIVKIQMNLIKIIFNKKKILNLM